MAAASGGLIFINGLGAIAGPLVTGWLMDENVFGPSGFFLVVAVLLFAMALYATYRMTQRATVPVEDTGVMAPVYPSSTPVAVELAQEFAIEVDQEGQDGADTA